MHPARICRSVAVYLASGLIVSIGIALLCVVIMRPPIQRVVSEGNSGPAGFRIFGLRHGENRIIRIDSTFWQLERQATVDSARPSAEITSQLPGWSQHLVPGRWCGSDGDWTSVAISAGWPFRCLRGEAAFAWQRMSIHRVISVGAIIVEQPRHRAVRSVGLIPCTPDPVGLMANTAIYAAILYLIMSGTRKLVRRNRVQRSRCPSCGYKMHRPRPGREYCPECGWAPAVPRTETPVQLRLGHGCHIAPCLPTEGDAAFRARS